jgi:hypothetical protein
MIRRIGQFAFEFCKTWGAVLTGGFCVALIASWQFTGHSIPPRIGWWIVIGGVIVAAFQVWERQVRRAEVVEQELASLREANRNGLFPPPLIAPELQVEEPKPRLSIEVVDVRTTTIIHGDHGTMTEFSRGYPAVVMSFKNRPSATPGKQTEAFYDVTANLTYVGSDRTEHIDYGNWLDEYTRRVDFRPGETRDLVIAMRRPEIAGVVGLYNPKKHNPLKGRIRAGMIIVHDASERPLPSPPCEVTIMLVADNTTLLSEHYRLNWTENGNMEIQKRGDEHHDK